MEIQGADMELSPFYYNRGGQLHVRTLYYNLFCTNFEFSKISLNLRGVTIRLKKNKLTRKISFSKSENLDPCPGPCMLCGLTNYSGNLPRKTALQILYVCTWNWCKDILFIRKYK